MSQATKGWRSPTVPWSTQLAGYLGEQPISSPVEEFEGGHQADFFRVNGAW